MVSFLLFIFLTLPVAADDFLSGFMGGGGGGGDEFYEDEFSEGGFEEDSPRWQVENAVDLLEKNRELKLTAEQFIYPFDVLHKPMLSSNLVPSVQGGAEVFRNTTVRKLEDPKAKLQVNNRKPTPQPNPQAALAALIAKQTPQVRKKGEEKDKPQKEIKLPDFDISGKFGTPEQQYIVIGNRYYGVDEKLKGTRDMRRVRLIGIDEHMAYFSYEDTIFPKKIKALERIF